MDRLEYSRIGSEKKKRKTVYTVGKETHQSIPFSNVTDLNVRDTKQEQKWERR